MSKVPVLALSLVLLAPPPTRAALEAEALALDAAGVVVGVRHAHGVHARLPDGRYGYSCAALGAGGERLLATGDGRLLTTGADGVQLTSDAGCKWRVMLGAAGVRPIVGAHADPAAPQRLVFGLGGGDGPKLAVSGDGGFTSDLLASLVVAQTELTGLAGVDQRLFVTAVGDDGAVAAWLSDDFGDTVSPVGVVWPEALPEPPAAAALSAGSDAFAWAGGELLHVDLGAGTATRSRAFARARAPVTLDDQGRLWVAAGAEGLWRRATDGPWGRVGTDEAWSVLHRGGRLWVGHAGRAGEPWVSASDDGAVFEAVVPTPGEVLHPETCATLAEPTCAEASGLLRVALEVAGSGAEVAEPEAPRPGGDGCAAGASPSGLAATLLLGLAWGVRRRRRVP